MLVSAFPVYGSAWTAGVKASQDCVAWQYSVGKKSPYLSYLGCHFAEIQLYCDVDDLPAGATVSYQWAPVYTANPVPPVPGGAIWVPSPGSAQHTLGWAFDDTGLYTAQCTVTVHLQSGTQQVQSVSMQFLAAGGPMKLKAASPDGGWPASQASNYVDTWEYDRNNSDLPHYLQYFNYDPTGGAFPILSQRPRLGTVTWYMETPDLPIKYGWQIPVGLSLMPGQGDPQSLALVKVGATGQSGAAALQPRCLQEITFRGKQYSILDNSDQAPNPNKPQEGPSIDHYCFTAHKPLDTDPNSADDLEQPISPYGWSLDVYPIVSDNLGELMPSVWVQERFQPPVPVGNFQINTSKQFWTTLSAVTYAYPAGRFDSRDWLRITGNVPHVYAAHPNNPVYNYVHHYYAASKLTGGTSGCFVSTYRMKFWTDRIDHIKE